MTTPASDLGAFSISLAVKDLTASRDFYRKLGFEPVGGKLEQNWLILRNGITTIGLFQGMFERNMLTFNPGWDSRCAQLEQFTDVRALQQRLEAAGVALATKVEAGSTTGPASFVVVDPDGNPILVDQHV
jgi:lactoylglutathione lyase